MSKDTWLSFVCFGKGSLAFQNEAQDYKSVGKRENRKLLGKKQLLYGWLFYEEGRGSEALQSPSLRAVPLWALLPPTWTPGPAWECRKIQQFQIFVSEKNIFLKGFMMLKKLVFWWKQVDQTPLGTSRKSKMSWLCISQCCRSAPTHSAKWFL